MDCIHIIDYGSQYTHLIARRLRTELGVWCEVLQPDQLDCLTSANTAGIILSGGPGSAATAVPDDASTSQEKRIVCDANIPVLGVCYGMQLMATCLGGRVTGGSQGEFGKTSVTFTAIFPDKASVWMSHNDVVTDPGSAQIIAHSAAGIAGIWQSETKCLGLQFHPEVRHTEHGNDYLAHFVVQMCGLALGSWNSQSRLEMCQKSIEERVREEDFVILGLSGGVDSMVTAALLSRSLTPSQWRAVYVDFGNMRDEERMFVVQCCERLQIPLHVVSMPEQCLEALRNVTDPEQKRKIMGALFVQAFRNAYLSCAPTVLCQGTIYPDIIESARSGSGKADVIKSHHNVGGLPSDLGMKLLEPLRWFFKDEVRLLGQELSLPHEVLTRHPFPGPGLTIRIIGEVTAAKMDIVRTADSIFMRHIREAGLYEHISQAYAALLEGNAVGVVGDQRRYGQIIALRAVCTDDFMTANVYGFDMAFLQTVATDIINKCPTVARVVYDVTSKPPGTIEFE
jgi:GMP synthase (glutamine-hydrolysing)